MRYATQDDPADVVVAWEAVEELLAAVPESPSRDVLRLVAAGWAADEIAERLGLAVEEVGTLAARGRIRILTAAVAASSSYSVGVRSRPTRRSSDPRSR